MWCISMCKFLHSIFRIQTVTSFCSSASSNPHKVYVQITDDCSESLLSRAWQTDQFQCLIFDRYNFRIYVPVCYGHFTYPIDLHRPPSNGLRLTETSQTQKTDGGARHGVGGMADARGWTPCGHARSIESKLEGTSDDRCEHSSEPQLIFAYMKRKLSFTRSMGIIDYHSNNIHWSCIKSDNDIIKLTR